MRSNIERRYTYGHWVYSENSGAPSLGLFDLELTYDANSAIKTLRRKGKQNTSGTYGIIDDLTYSYSGGRLQDVTDHAAKTVYDGAFNFMDNTINTHGGAPDYSYNANGALTRDYNKGISSISYDQFGNPLKVTFGNKSSIEYVYSADGIKLKVRHITAVPQSGTGSSSSSTNYVMSKDSTDYIGDFIYHNNKFSKYNWGNGYVQPLGGTSYAYRFYFKDHQGNNRLVTSYTGAVQQTTHYYPDGVTHDKSTEQGLQRYKYNGKELDRMHGLDWYDYGAREYDPTIGQFTSMDPLCEKYYQISPYAYCAGNPVKYVDPDGRYLAMYDDNGIQWRYNVTSGYFENNGNAYKGTNDFIKEVTGYLNYLCKGEAGKTLISDLVQRKEGISIVQDEMSGERERFSFRDDGIKSVVRFNPEQKVEGAKGGVVLGHELAHSQDRLNGTMLNEKWFDGQTKTVTISERYAMHWENLIRAEHGVVLRQYYADSDGRLYSNSKNECVSLYFDSKYPYNVNYKNVLPEGIKGYVYKSY